VGKCGLSKHPGREATPVSQHAHNVSIVQQDRNPP